MPEIDAGKSCASTSTATSTAATTTAASTAAAAAGGDDDDNDDDIPDMDAYDGENLEDDDPAALKSRVDDDNVIRTRTYDLTICYDKYYQTPRVWLFGYDEVRTRPTRPAELLDGLHCIHAHSLSASTLPSLALHKQNGNPLQPEQVFDDISSEHARKTVTLDFHPHLDNVRFAYIHPCRHAEVMKKIMDRMRESGKELRVDQYLLLFLKFISAVIPTIEYDYTMDIQGA